MPQQKDEKMFVETVDDLRTSQVRPVRSTGPGPIAISRITLFNLMLPLLHNVSATIIPAAVEKSRTADQLTDARG
jgi:hypothetical protein